MVFKDGEYTLYTREINFAGFRGKLTRIWFLAKKTPKIGTPCDMPEGYKVYTNKKTGAKFLQKW